MPQIEGKVVFITGASSGIGEATAMSLAQRGAKVDLGDPDVVLNALYGAINHRFVVPYNEAVLSMEAVDSLIDIIFRGIDLQDH